MFPSNHFEFTVDCVELVDVLVTTLIVDGGVVVTLVELTVVTCDVSFEDDELLLNCDVLDGVVVNTEDGDCDVVLVFGKSESTTPIGPDKSISLSGHVNSSG